MKLDDIIELWETDSKLDRTELGEESLKIPQLHSKYFKIFAEERLRLRQLQAEYKRLYRVKHEYYNGILSSDELQERGWEPFALKVLKADLSVYMDGDEDLQLITSKINIQEEKISFLESAIKSLSTRGYQIKSAIDWEKFKVGA